MNITCTHRKIFINTTQHLVATEWNYYFVLQMDNDKSIMYYQLHYRHLLQQQ